MPKTEENPVTIDDIVAALAEYDRLRDEADKAEERLHSRVFVYHGTKEQLASEFGRLGSKSPIHGVDSGLVGFAMLGVGFGSLEVRSGGGIHLIGTRSAFERMFGTGYGQMPALVEAK